MKPSGSARAVCEGTTMTVTRRRGPPGRSRTPVTRLSGERSAVELRVGCRGRGRARRECRRAESNCLARLRRPGSHSMRDGEWVGSGRRDRTSLAGSKGPRPATRRSRKEMGTEENRAARRAAEESNPAARIWSPHCSRSAARRSPESATGGSRTPGSGIRRPEPRSARRWQEERPSNEETADE